MSVETIRGQELRDFVRRSYGLRGTLRLHRVALGADLLRAPVNLFLAPVFLLTRILAALARWIRLRRLSVWFSGRRVFLETAVAAEVSRRTDDFLNRLEQQEALSVAPELRAVALRDYVSTRSAVAELVTTLFVLLAGLVIFNAPTPGMMSLAAPLADLKAKADAVAGFPLGAGLGRFYYSVFPASLPLWQMVMLGAGLAVIGALVTTFAGVLADPVQVMTGTHQRRLAKMLARLDRAEAGGIEREHLLARAGDLSDLGLSLWRMFRG